MTPYLVQMGVNHLTEIRLRRQKQRLDECFRRGIHLLDWDVIPAALSIVRLRQILLPALTPAVAKSWRGPE
jgi:hypothetical protein